MFTTASITLLAQTDMIVEIKYDFISSEDKIAFSMGEIQVEEKPVEDFIKEGK